MTTFDLTPGGSRRGARPAVKEPPQRHDRCRECCPYGGPCALDRHMPHQWHVCASPACRCHSAARYAAASPTAKAEQP